MAYTTIDDPSAHFKVKLYTGTGSSHAVTFDDTDTDMQPDLVWVATRNEAEILPMMNSLSGTEKYLRTNANDSEESDSNSITAFGSDGFTMGSTDRVNQSSNTFVAWCWKANGGAAAVSSNTNGSINTTKTSANTDAGFSVSTYTGTGSNATVGHGLGAVPEMLLFKKRNSVSEWLVYHKSFASDPETDYMVLHGTGALVDNATAWQDTAPTSTVYSLGTYTDTNGSGGTMVALAWTGIQGYSKFSTYIGNGSTSGPVVWLGFRPAMIMLKRIDSTGGWYIYDNKRPGRNNENGYLQANSASAEDTNSGNFGFDILANGFKLRGSYATVNASGGKYIYMAFADLPFVNSEGEPANAR